VVYDLAWDALAVDAIAAVVDKIISIHRNMLLARALKRLLWLNIIITLRAKFTCTLIPLLLGLTRNITIGTLLSV
jgi:hypothetical protein